LLDDEAFASLKARRSRCKINLMSLRGRVFAATYDRMSAKAEKAGLASHRQLLLTGASGRVLEIGGGTGANLQYYGPGVETLTLTEPEAPMLKRLVRRARDEAPDATVLRAPAEDLPWAGDS
jgi:ubiquinone/menaquinone biosynthesis C-methylase UbiE